VAPRLALNTDLFRAQVPRPLPPPTSPAAAVAAAAACRNHTRSYTPIPYVLTSSASISKSAKCLPAVVTDATGTSHSALPDSGATRLMRLIRCRHCSYCTCISTTRMADRRSIHPSTHPPHVPVLYRCP
jgi:hypothetical protein